MNNNSFSKPQSFRVYLGTFIIAFSTLAIEITLTRLLSVITYYHLAFFAVSTAMLGMTAGAITVYIKPDWFKENNIHLNTAKACIGFSISVGVALILLCIIPVKINFSLIQLTAILLVTVACSLPFYFSGMVISVVLTKFPLPIGKLYASDLIGASLGCLFVLGGLEIFDAPGLILLSGAVGIISVYCFGFGSISVRLKQLGYAVFAILIAGVTLNMFSYGGFRPVRPVFVKGAFENPKNNIVEKWNSFSRIIVKDGLETSSWNWGPSPVMPKDQKSFAYHMNIDGDAGTWLTRFSKPEDIRNLRYDITNAAYYLREGSESACIIGVGGGRDIHSAILFGFKKIVGIDINPIFINLLKSKFRYEANIADNENVELVIDEARSYLSRTDRKFSFIQMSLIDTWASTGAGAFTLSENSLYTVEAWKVILNRLDSNGIFTLTRWYNPSNPGETGRVVSLALVTLLDLGRTDPSMHIAMLTLEKLSTLIVSKAPFTASEIARIKEISADLKYNLAIVPGEAPSHEILKRIVSSKTEEELHSVIKDEPLNYMPPTDDNPYFFNMLRLNHLNSVNTSEAGVHTGNLTATISLVVLIFSLLILTFITIILPLVYVSRRKILSINMKIFWNGALYFSLIGAGFMLTEIALMQRLSVFLSHPVYALGILLFTIILSTGIGSYFSEHFNITSVPWKYVLPAFAAAAIVVVNLILNAVISSMITSNMMSKVIVSIAIIFPLGFTMGFFFPLGMRFAKSFSPEETPWFWGLNGIFGVLFSAIAVFISIYVGISVNFYLASLCYAGLLLIIKGFKKQVAISNEQ